MGDIGTVVAPSLYQYTPNKWWYCKKDTSTWYPSAPGEQTDIFVDLVKNGQIPDPFEDDNEKAVQWVGTTDWNYKTEFRVTDTILNSYRYHELVFEGLDTFTTVYVNGTEIVKTDNMFIKYKVNVSEHLVSGVNVLEIRFESAYNKGKALEAKCGRRYGTNGDASRVYLRKAQSHYGWDWGPVLITCGVYKPVRVLAYNSFIEEVYPKVDVSANLEKATILVQVSTTNGRGQLEMCLFSPGGKLVETKVVDAAPECSDVEFTVNNPLLWNPCGYGKQHLYTLDVRLGNQKVTRKVGIRTLELVQETFPDSPGTSFYFKVNNNPLFINGCNWIPGHSFPSQLKEKDYEDWVQLIADGNQNMVRIWGGGCYEPDTFYDLCDKLGVLVWQDFMFACGQYPGTPTFIDVIREEATYQLKRLRNHCCLALFAGNNEDYQIAEQFRLQWDKGDLSGDYSKTNFPARTLYENVLPKLVKEHAPQIPYHPGSPWGGNSANDRTIGDIHQWNVWHASQDRYQDGYKSHGRFVSEFGMEGLPDIKTYEKCITDPTELYPQSRLVAHHNKADGFERRLAVYVFENIKLAKFDLKSWIYATQLMQAECHAYAYKCWRRNWKGDRQRYQGGAIVWQINDCWPVASWSLVDFYKRPKLAYYSVKRESRPRAIGFDRNDSNQTIDIWGANSTSKEEQVDFVVEFYDIVTGDKIEVQKERQVLKENGCTDFRKGLQIPQCKHPVVVYVTISQGSELVADAFDWPQPLKYLKFPDRKVTHKLHDDEIEISTNKPVKGVQIITERDVYLSDNGFDMVSGQTRRIVAHGLTTSDDVTINYYDKSL